jgi:hypothetical protein
LAIQTKKLSLFCKRDEEQTQAATTEGVRKPTRKNSPKGEFLAIKSTKREYSTSQASAFCDAPPFWAAQEALRHSPARDEIENHYRQAPGTL